MSTKEIKILFLHLHDEILISENPRFHLFFEYIKEQGYHCDVLEREESTKETIEASDLAGYAVVVIGCPHNDLTYTEAAVLESFVRHGGGLWLVHDADSVKRSRRVLSRLFELAGVHAKENFNDLPATLTRLSAHYLTANLEKIHIGKSACFQLQSAELAIPLAWTEDPEQLIVTAATVGDGRIVCLADVDGLSTDIFPGSSENQQFVTNILAWLSNTHELEIQSIKLPSTLNWAENATVDLCLRNTSKRNITEIQCILESSAGAKIVENVQTLHALPKEHSVCVMWQVQAKRIGLQKLRLLLNYAGKSLCFYHLPPLKVEAVGDFKVEVHNLHDELCQQFESGDKFTLSAWFDWKTEQAPYPLDLNLAFDAGKLLLLETKQVASKHIWMLQAIEAGTQHLSVSLSASAQEFPLTLNVSHSLNAQITELYACCVAPLEAEIVARLKAVDKSLCSKMVRKQKFKILPPEEYVKQVYPANESEYLHDILQSAHRERYFNNDLLDLVLDKLVATYVPGQGAYIPCDPSLASKLAHLHPLDYDKIESSLLFAHETKPERVKQLLAAYLLHEKYGHGFFYTQTRLGQQITLLQKHGFPNNPAHSSYAYPVNRLFASAVLVNEGFAAWLELLLLPKLNAEIRAVVYDRHKSLLESDRPFNLDNRHQSFFKDYPPNTKTRYKQVYEYLDFISRKFSPRCAIQAFLYATNVEFGISEDQQGKLVFLVSHDDIRKNLSDDCAKCAHLRLEKIANYLYSNIKMLQQHIKTPTCPHTCNKNCLLQDMYQKILLQ
jgi:hypothetical protein